MIPEIKGPFGIGFIERYHYFAVSPKILVEFRDPSLPGKNRKRKRIGKWNVIFFNYFNSRPGNYLYGKSQSDISVKEHIIARYMFIDDLYSFYPTKYKMDKRFKDLFISTAIKSGYSRINAEKFYYEQAIKRGGLSHYFQNGDLDKIII